MSDINKLIERIGKEEFINKFLLELSGYTDSLWKYIHENNRDIEQIWDELDIKGNGPDYDKFVDYLIERQEEVREIIINLVKERRHAI